MALDAYHIIKTTQEIYLLHLIRWFPLIMKKMAAIKIIRTNVHKCHVKCDEYLRFGGGGKRRSRSKILLFDQG